MDRLKLETVYLRALDALMSADEYQIQAAIFRLRRAQARLHGWEVQRGSVRQVLQRRSRLAGVMRLGGAEFSCAFCDRSY